MMVNSANFLLGCRIGRSCAIEAEFPTIRKARKYKKKAQAQAQGAVAQQQVLQQRL
jgi:hypothetical protein